MGFQYTEDQQKVISLRNRNILVSAAAGSGKTAVLTERIVDRLKSKEEKIDIDRLLIVTFTNAAAAEMRERIRMKIMECLDEEPENEHLQKQASLIHNAQITTIDSFCLFVIRNNFNDIGLDPGFRIADEGELKLMKQDVLDALLEEEFEKASEDFLYCVDCYSTGNNETILEENIKKLYEFSMSYPWPEEWLKERVEDYHIENVEQLEQSQWGRLAAESNSRTIRDCLERIEQAIHICEQPDGPYMYGELLETEKEMLEKLSRVETLSEMETAIEKVQFGRLPSKKDDSVSTAKRENVKNIRAEIKDTIQGIKEKYFFQSLEKSAEQCKACERAVGELLRLTLSFKQKLDEKKREKNIIDFSDMEHFALNILLERKEDGSVVPTKTALDYRAYFKEIMIDEYQDSNLVQEYLLQSISGEDDGNYNRFMVGDVKQSIYKFRLARPEIFMEKYHEYALSDSEKQRIDLHQNFRSRRQVVDSANYVFYQTLGAELGGIDYDDNAALYFGASFLPELPEDAKWDDDTELLLVEKPEKDTELSAKESEAYAIAKRIKELLKENLVTDKETGELRKATYKDIVILLRTNSGWDEEFKKVFQEEGIPAYITSKTGYFKTTEIQTLLQFLRVLDNPRQDIPLFGVLHSVFGGFSEEEMAQLKIETEGKVKKEALLYDRLSWIAEMQGRQLTEKDETASKERQIVESVEKKEQVENQHKEGISEEADISVSLSEKVLSFLEKLNRYRQMVAYKPIHELLQTILTENNYLLYVAAMPSGEQRKANVEMLLEKAAAFEQTSYHGLFHFIRYIEQMEKYDVDYGEAGTLEEEADVVRIMSIHKSKGLEFPICFVAGLSKKFNMQDTTKPLIADVDMGIGTDFIDPKLRIRNKTLRKNVMAGKMRLDNVAEELRVLYVALTRAKEKLIMTGTIDKPVEKISALSYLLMHKEALLPYSVLSSAGSYMDFILAACIRHPKMQEILQENGLDTGTGSIEGVVTAPLKIQIIGTEDLVKAEVEEQVTFEGKREQLNMLSDIVEKISRKENKEQKEISRIENKQPENNWTESNQTEGIKSESMQTETESGNIFESIKGKMNLDKTLYNDLKERFSFVYPYENLADLYTKTTVSELKKAGQNEELDFSFHLIEEEEIVPYIPAFMKEKEEVSGTTRGSAMHKIMELLDFEKVSDKDGVLKTMEEEFQDGRLSEEFKAAIRVDKVAAFLKSDLCRRMKKAQQNGLLYREAPFVYGIRANRLNAKFPEEETVLVQGIIDVYFEEEGNIVVADYKTDVVEREEELIKRYKAQLDYYAEALERLTGKSVKEKVIYSFYLGIEIAVE